MQTNIRRKPETRVEPPKIKKKKFNPKSFDINFNQVNETSMETDLQGISETIVLDGNVLTFLNAKKIEELSSSRAHSRKSVREQITKKTVISNPERTIILDLKKGLMEYYIYIKGVIHRLFIHLGLKEDKPDPILEEFRRFSLLYQMYCTNAVEIIAYHSAFGRAYYELKELIENKNNNFDDIKKIFSDFGETFLW